MNCWSCQVENPSTAKFCFNCGSRLVVNPATEAPCRQCAAPLPLDARFCGNCGTPDPVAPPPAAAPAAPREPDPSAEVSLADLLEPAGPPDAAPEGSEAAALAYDHEEEDEATILRSGLEEAPMVAPTPGLKSRDHMNTEPAKVAMARTLAERMGKGGDSPGAYSKQGPSLRKGEKGKPPPPPAIGAAKPAAAGKGAPSRKKADTEQNMPRAGVPAQAKTPAAAAPTAAAGSKLPPVPGLGARPVRPVAGAQPAATPSASAPAPSSPSVSMTVPAPSRAAPGGRSVTGEATPSASTPSQVPPSSTSPLAASSGTVPAPSKTAPGVPTPTGSRGVPREPSASQPAAVSVAPGGTAPALPRVEPSEAPASASMTVPAPSRTSTGPREPAFVATPAPPGEAARVAPSPAPTSASMTVPAPSRSTPSSASLPAMGPPRPSSTLESPAAGAASSSRSKPRTVTEPQKAVFASPSASEVAEILAPPEGWPDITDELAEVRFSALQGVDDGVRAELEALRAKHPGHPDLETLAAELGVIDDALSLDSFSPEDSLELPVGVPRRTRPPVQPAAAPAGTPVDGPPPLGRFPITASTPPASSPSRPGVPRPAPVETSDELLDRDDEFDDLDEDDPAESMTDLTIVERVDLERLGVRDADELDDPDDEPADDLDEPDEPDFLDRTMMVPALQPPAPYGGVSPPGASTVPPPSRSAGERRATLAPEPSRVADERQRSTLAPGALEDDDEPRSGLVPSPRLRSDELGATLPPPGSGEPDDADNPPTLAGMMDDGVPSFAHDEPTPVPPGRATVVPDTDGPPAPAPFSGSEPDGFMTAPDRDADTAAASGTFRVADLGLDDMPDLSSGLPPEIDVDLYATAPGPEELDDDDLDVEITHEGTVVARAPLPPAPYGQAAAAVPVLPVRLVMLGARGEPVAERRIEPGGFLDVGRSSGEPWAEDRRMEPLHARLFPGPGGVVVDDFGLPSGVYTQISDTIAVEDGDEFKVGQARLALQRVTGRGWGQLTVVRHDSPAPLTIVLERDEFIIGREEGDLTLPSDTFVSGDHCRFIREGNAVYLEDLGSSNGTYIRVRAGQCVAFGGLVLIGHTQFRVLQG